MNSTPNTPAQPSVPNSYLRILHASPDAPPVDIYVNSNIIARGLAYRQFTNYIPLAPGPYTIRVFPAGQLTNPVINTNVTIPSESVFTAAAVGMLADISLMPIPEVYDPELPMPQNAYVRFVHLSPNAPAVDVTLPDGSVLFRNIPYRSFTQYMMLAPGNYTLLVKPTGSTQAVLTIPNLRFRPGTMYSVYAIGLVGGQPPLEAITSIDSNYR